MCKKLGTARAEKWYSHIPKTVCEHKDITVLWNRGAQTDSCQYARHKKEETKFAY